MRRVLVTVAVLLIASSAVADATRLVGRPAPSIRARPLHGDTEIGLARYRGSTVLLAFVATWCSACRRLAPTLEALSDEHRERGLVLLALSHEPRARLRRHVEARAPRIPWLQCTGRTAVSYGADGLPTVVLVDREGVVRHAYQGGTEDVARALRRDVARLLEDPG